MPAAYVRPWSPYTNRKRFFNKTWSTLWLPEVTSPKFKIPRFLPVKTCPATNNQPSPYQTPLKGPHLHALRKENLVYLPDRRQQLDVFIRYSCYGVNGSNGNHLELLHVYWHIDIHSQMRAKNRDITMPSSIFKYSKCNVLYTIDIQSSWISYFAMFIQCVDVVQGYVRYINYQDFNDCSTTSTIIS